MARRRGGNIGRLSKTEEKELSQISDSRYLEDNPAEAPIDSTIAFQKNENQTKANPVYKGDVPSPKEENDVKSIIDAVGIGNAEPELDIIPKLSEVGQGQSAKESIEVNATRTDPQAQVVWGRKKEPPIFTGTDSDFDRDHLSKVDISQRKGNYLLSVGLPRSGKTVLQSYMTYYMDVAGTLHATLDIREPDGSMNYEAQRIKTVWLESWKRGELPDSTPVGEDEIRELRLDVVNAENKSQKFNLSFLEISGENFLNVVPSERNIPKLFDRLKAFLSNRKIKLNLVFVLKPNEPNDQASCDALFTNFMTFVQNELSIKISKRVGLILVLPNTKEIFGKSNWERSRVDEKFYTKTMKDYVYKNFPATYRIWDGWNRKNRAIMSFHIGDVENEKLLNKSFDDVKAFIDLNYKLFTGTPLQPKFSIFRRLFGS